MFKYAFLIVCAAGVAYFITPLVRWIAIRVGALDQPNERKVHTQPTPRLGGVAIFVAFHALVWLGLGWMALGDYAGRVLTDQWWRGFVPASCIILAIGILDDVRPLGAAIKFLTQLSAAGVAVYFGFQISDLTLPWGDVHLGIWTVPLTMLWIVGLTNAFNLIDGLDGLAAGVALISALTLAAVAQLNQQIGLALMCVTLAGALVGFLRYNFHPASIFLGDSGSLFLGFTLAVLSIQTSHKSAAAASVLVPMLAFGLPIMDTSLAMLRRFLASAHILETDEKNVRVFFAGGKSMFRADREHVHHRLLKLGITHRNAVVVLYGICMVLAGAALALATLRNLNTGLVLFAMGVATVIAVQKLRYKELQWLRSGALRPFTRLPALASPAIQMIVDIVLVIVAYYLAHWIKVEGKFDIARPKFLASLPLILLVKILVFHATGLYRVQWQHAGIPDLLRGVRSMFLACVASTALVGALPVISAGGWNVLVIDFFVMSSLLLGLRFSIRVLDYYAQSNPADKRKALIYGTGHNASLLIRELLANDKLGLTPVGFFEDGTSIEHKTLHGYPIVDASQTLDQTLESLDIQELIIAVPEVPPARLKEIEQCCRPRKIAVRHFRVSIEPVSPGA